MKKQIYLIISLLIFISLNCQLINGTPSNSSNETFEKKKKYISFFLNSTIETLDDNNFDKIVLKGIFHDFIILFTVKKCDICNKIISTLENIQKKYNETRIIFAKVDILMSGWTSMRFELEKLPNIIYVSNRSYAIYSNDILNEKDIISFIEDKNKIFKPFPKKMGYFDVFMKIFHIISGLLHEKFPFWNENYSWLLVVLFILFFCFVEYLIIKFCCNRTKREKKNQSKYQHQHQHIHQNKKDKKIINSKSKYNKSKID